jgi:cytochrome c oxidase cbb3-type subunit 2
MKKILLAAFVMVAMVISGSVVSFGADQTKNPFDGNKKMVKEGQKIFDFNCKSCHGEGGKGDICPDLTKKKKKYGDSDAELFTTISKGRQGGMPNWDKTLGTEKIWKVITYNRSVEK